MALCYIVLDMGRSLAHEIPPDWFLRRRLKLRQLALITALGECQGLRRAATAMGLTQPAATKLLREIENTLDVPLFERLPRGMRPTPYGMIMIRRARSILAALDRAREEVAALAAGESGTVAIGCVQGAAPSLLVPALAAMRSGHVQVRLQVLVDAPEVLMPQLREGRLDLVLSNVPADLDGPDLTFAPLLEAPLVVVAHPGHPLVRARKLSWRALPDVEWIVHPQDSPHRLALEGLIAGNRAGATYLPNLIQTASIIATMMMLERTDMLAIIPFHVAAHYAERGLLAILPLTVPVTLGPIGIVTYTGRALSPAGSRFMEEVRRIAAGAQVAKGPLRSASQTKRPGSRASSKAR